MAPPWTAEPAAAVSAAIASPARAARRVEPDVRPVGAGAGGDGYFFAIATKGPGRAEERKARPIRARPFPAPRQAIPAPGPSAHATALPPPPARRSAPPARPGPAAPTSSRRWSLSAWSFVRPGDGAALATGGVLGGSQAGARLVWRLNRDLARPLALSFRVSAPLRRTRGAEAALGVDWRPARRLPLHLLAERRQGLGREGRSAFALAVYGGVPDSRIGPFRIDAYAQAGMVGARSRDPFADGSARISLPMGDRVRLGAGAWAAAQPGLARLDLGPQAALRLPVAGRAVTIAADWRVRVAGNTAPGSGPTVTLATDF